MMRLLPSWRFDRLVDFLSVRLFNRHFARPTQFGSGPHDCALVSLYWAVPRLSESDIRLAFDLCTESWPYAGVTNREFSGVLDHLHVRCTYTDQDEVVADVLRARIPRGVVLLMGHFAPVVAGRFVGSDAHLNSCLRREVVCKWIFS